jgi:DNA-binding response OmpR family regulator
MDEKPKILVVDDDPDILRAITKVLQSREYRVVTAANGEEGLDKIREERPDLLILDLLMPRKDGFAVVRELKESPKFAKHATMPILILTSVREDASRRRYELETGLRMDVDDYVEKPIPPLDLLHRVERLLAKRK